MNFLSRYLPRIDFDSYQDFKDNYRVIIPDNFNFGYDIVDEYARLEPSKPALLWLNDDGDEAEFTFGDVKEYSDRIANLLTGLGIGKGDRVMLILKQRPEVWFTASSRSASWARPRSPRPFSSPKRTSSTAATPRTSK